MKRLAKVPRSGWMVVGMLATLILAPTVAVAATTTLVSIKGVGATANKQLLTTEATAASYQVGSAVESVDGCSTLTKPPAGKALIVDELVFDPADVTPPTTSATDMFTNAFVQVYVELQGTPACGAGYLLSNDFNAAGQDVTIPLTPGLAIPAGYQLSLKVTGVGLFSESFGYSVPANDVPSTPSSALLRREAPRGRRGGVGGRSGGA
jgi:hypothetical protein